MSEPQEYVDEVGSTLGPQRAAAAALEVELDGMEPPRDSGVDAPPASTGNAGAPPPDPAASAAEWEQILSSGFGALFALLSARWKSFETTPAEVDALAKAWTPVAVKHAGGAIPIEAIAILATAAIVAPKAIGAMREQKAAKAAKAKEAATRDPGTHYT